MLIMGLEPKPSTRVAVITHYTITGTRTRIFPLIRGGVLAIELRPIAKPTGIEPVLPPCFFYEDKMGLEPIYQSFADLDLNHSDTYPLYFPYFFSQLVMASNNSFNVIEDFLFLLILSL